MYHIINHLLSCENMPVEYLPTPNIGRDPILPELIVIHYTGDTSADGAIAWLRDPRSKASAHLVIDRDGRITQLAAFDRRCWHAGKSTWRGRDGVNAFSIGIEMVNAGVVYPAGDGWATSRGRPIKLGDAVALIHKNESKPRVWQIFPAAQIEALTEVCRALLEAYPEITEIVGHDDIAPLRKVDPGPAFPMAKLRTSLGLGE